MDLIFGKILPTDSTVVVCFGRFVVGPTGVDTFSDESRQKIDGRLDLLYHGMSMITSLSPTNFATRQCDSFLRFTSCSVAMS